MVCKIQSVNAALEYHYNFLFSNELYAMADRRQFITGVATVGTVTIAGCLNDTDESSVSDDETDEMDDISREGPVEVVRNYFSAIDRGDAEAANSYLHPDGELREELVEQLAEDSAEYELGEVELAERNEQDARVETEIVTTTEEESVTAHSVFFLQLHNDQWKIFDQFSGEEVGDDANGLRVFAAMPAVWDFTRQVGGEHINVVSDAVPTGESGYDYSPTSGVIGDIEAVDAFVYLPDYADWIDELVTEHENGDTVEVIDASAGIDSFDRPVEEDDKHWWLDPVVAKTGVDNIVEGLSELDPDHAADYEANGEAFKNDLDEIDAQFQDIVDRAELDTAVVATYNSFGWWVDRYGIEVISPFGITPDAESSPSDVGVILDTIEEQGIDYILNDIGESTIVAETFVEETDVEILPLSSIQTQLDGTPEIGFPDGREINMSPDWGYVEHFEEINLPTMEVALET